jgi:hypothetical protein
MEAAQDEVTVDCKCNYYYSPENKYMFRAVAFQVIGQSSQLQPLFQVHYVLILLVNTVLCTTEQCRILWSFKVV